MKFLRKNDSRFLLISGVAYFLFGLAFSSMLVLPALNLSTQASPLQVTLSYLSFYYLGRLVGGYLDHLVIRFGRKYYLSFALLLNLAGLLFVQAQGMGQLASFLFGLSLVLSGISLREYLTASSALSLKKVFNSLTTIAWSLGIGFQSVLFIEYPSALSWLLATLALLAILLPFLAPSTLIRPTTTPKPNSPIFNFVRRSIHQPPVLVLFLGYLVCAAGVNLVNAQIVPHMTTLFSFPEKYISMILALPILGAILSSVSHRLASFNFRTLTKYIFFVSTTLSAGLFLFVAKDFSVFIACAIFFGFTSNEDTSFAYQLVSENISSADRRQAHALIDITSVVGAGLSWYLGHVFTDVLSSFAVVFTLFAFILIYMLYKGKSLQMSQS